MSIRNQFSYRSRQKEYKYYDFIKSDLWEQQKEDWYSRHPKICAKCGSDESIHLHHKKYPKTGKFLNLDDSAFVALCKFCHKEFHDTYGVKRNMQRESNLFIKGNMAKKSVNEMDKEYQEKKFLVGELGDFLLWLESNYYESYARVAVKSIVNEKIEGYRKEADDIWQMILEEYNESGDKSKKKSDSIKP